MRILFVRHADPDYTIDSLTETGFREAALLAPRLAGENIQDFYVSPLGRAKDTAAPALKLCGKKAVEKEWLQEFVAQLDITGSSFLQAAYPDTRKNEDGAYRLRHHWDILPSAWRNDPAWYTKDGWRELPVGTHSKMGEMYDHVTSAFDEVLATYGYRRQGGLYIVEKENRATIAFVCHLGITLILLSHLWGVSPFVLPNMLCIPPSGVTEMYSEEREKGIAIFRTTRIGDTSHLYVAGEKPSFAARFCELYSNDFERH